MHVVVIDDQPRMVELVTSYLEESGVRTTGCYDGESGLAAIAEHDPDAVVLDLMLPGLSGTGVCRALRAAGNQVPILMLTARGEVSERVAGLEAGADDYLVKPFALEELHARIRAIARRRDERPSSVLVAGDVSIDLGTRRVRVGDAELSLARREFDMLTTLMDPPGRVVSKQRLFEEVWGDEADLRSNSLEVYVSRLRHHLRASSIVSITTLRSVGYRLDTRT
ncbi:DNA-binding response OmpR family regulator [Nocardioides aromaticivorans]|uniref:DNA-binding response OmpR family regulator n=1 Tax=Nocardioides aromaticivorans TaxID=200618 RepID=A0A7Y9ZN25_9ACTN|nr:response regulator transcription factor [Nocardioides aromaticivorans]NYI46586.1 DNA-binding response OmpR family regulator [Nocardioides aromaticivorans]